MTHFAKKIVCFIFRVVSVFGEARIWNLRELHLAYLLTFLVPVVVCRKKENFYYHKIILVNIIKTFAFFIDEIHEQSENPKLGQKIYIFTPSNMKTEIEDKLQAS